MNKLCFASCLFFTLLAGTALQAQTTLPDAAGQSILIKNTIVALNHGNLTGNYTVLRDLASKRFREQHTASDLANTFSNLRTQKLDLSPILVSEPRLSQPPAEDKFRGRLQLVGHFPTRPQAVQFALTFQRIDAGWMIDEISVGLAPAPPAQPIAQPRSPQTTRRLPTTSPHQRYR